MEIQKVEFLNDLNQTISFLESYVTGVNEVKKLTFYKKGKVDDEHAYERSFNDLEEVKRDYRQEFYDKAERITMVVKTADDLITVICDKKTATIAVATSKKEKREELRRIQEQPDYSKIVKDDGCVYYLFEFGQIGKYDPNNYGYYLYKDGEWEVSGSVMRWVEDPAYNYTIIGGEDVIHK